MILIINVILLQILTRSIIQCDLMCLRNSCLEQDQGGPDVNPRDVRGGGGGVGLWRHQPVLLQEGLVKGQDGRCCIGFHEEVLNC